MKKIAFIILFSFLLISYIDPYTIKRISDANFRYEFYTTTKENNIKNNRIFYWFKGGLIHSTQGGFSGELLHGEFKKHYHSNQLAESGKFKKGLKIKLWKTWHKNGNIETTQNWSDGLQAGTYTRYNENKVLVEKGSYNFGKKNGKWIDFIKKDTVFFKNGELYIPKPKLTKEEKKTLKEKEKKEKELNKSNNHKKKSNPDLNKNKEKTTKTKKAKTEKVEKKDNFCKRIFGKKSKNDKSS